MGIYLSDSATPCLLISTHFGIWMGWHDRSSIFYLLQNLTAFLSPNIIRYQSQGKMLGTGRATDRLKKRRENLVDFVFVCNLCLLRCQILINHPLFGIWEASLMDVFLYQASCFFCIWGYYSPEEFSC